MHCPCGSTLSFKQCCFAIHDKSKLASSPEQLMRARYSAYATNSAQFIYNTYATTSRAAQSINDIQAWADNCKWVSLKVIKTTEGNELLKQLPTVEFTARYLENNKLFEMHEVSRFIKENEQWYYLDGEVGSHQQIAQLQRNDPCPCNSGKKFKKCCG